MYFYIISEYVTYRKMLIFILFLKEKESETLDEKKEMENIRKTMFACLS